MIRFNYKKLKSTAHKTKKINTKNVDVDLKILPIVNWLNTFEGVYTIYSCQGRKGENGVSEEKPYVIFFCFSLTDLINILDKAGGLYVMTVQYFDGYIRYIMEFKSVDAVEETINYMRFRKII